MINNELKTLKDKNSQFLDYIKCLKFNIGELEKENRKLKIKYDELHNDLKVKVQVEKEIRHIRDSKIKQLENEINELQVK